MDWIVRDTLEVLMVVGVGAMVWSVLRRLRRGTLTVAHCPACDRPASRAYPVCRFCGTIQPTAR